MLISLREVMIGPLADGDPRLIQYLRSYIIYRPSLEPYNLDNPDTPGNQYIMELLVQYLFNNKTGGVFIEAGAYDGETSSATLYLEAKYQWTGLLVEPNHQYHTQLLRKNRKAWFLPACISPHTSQPQLTLYRMTR